ncbi:methyl-accepting chemotaxis protein [Geotalea sp. SG265]|uniref:methyl-accepting chemotaxis protein n=1 Tax=Geotalea sp. SG265 TaxID=2922867 RepID=UPI00243510FC|nr:methyl-accepting chemotaxis protein [Geotalea sp. SG265]
MQWFYNLKIGTKLLSSFIILAAIAGVIGAIGIANIHKADDNGQTLYENVTVPIAHLGEISTGFQRVRVNLAKILLVHDRAEKQKYSEQIKELSEEITKKVELAEKAFTGTEEKTLLKDFSDSRTVFRPLIGRIADLSMAGRDAEALALYNGEATQAAMAEQSAMNKLVEFKVKEAKATSQQNSAMAKGAISFTLVLAVVGVILAIGFGLFITRIITAPLQEAVRTAQLVAGGDLTCKVEPKFSDETGQLLSALKEMNGSLVDIVRDVRNGADSIATATEQISAGNADLSQRTEEQASALEETASSMEELTSTVKQNADNAQQANQLAISASSVAVKGGEVITRVVDTMGSISDSSRKISDIIGVIDGIAFQTNILALNAAVEAARAGEQGRGFAVVAAEVRSLAQRSAAAAKEIKALIEDSVSKVEDGSRLVEEAGHTTQEIVTSIKRVTDIMAEISAASLEQSSGIEQVNTAITQMDDVTQQNAALVEQAAAAAESLEEQAGQLVEMVSRFKLDETLQSRKIAMEKKVRRIDALQGKPAAAKAKPVTAPARLAKAEGHDCPASEADDWKEF